MKILRFFPPLLRILIGVIFLLSGILKLFPIEPFELNFIDLGIANWYTAPIIARLIISAEFFLGLMLIFGISLRNFTWNTTLLTLIFFTVYLFVQLVREGNDVNCGCFGTYLHMTPWESIIKNGMLITGLLFLRYVHPNAHRRSFRWLSLVCLMLAVVIPFILNPIDLMAAELRQPEKVNFPLDSSVINGDVLPSGTISQLDSGKHIVAFLSMTCVHCKSAALKLHIMKKRHPEIPCSMILNGKEKNLQHFLSETKSANVPHMLLLGKPFARVTGGKVPTIFWVENGIVTRKSQYISLEEEEILRWLHAP